jgi:NAD(P)-dependent dehydrogenase (short-subunit alcohol dehydrogenase family)
MNNNLDNLFRLNNKIIVITGAAGLLGTKHAHAIAAYGGTPILLDISHDSVESLSQNLNAKYGIKSMALCIDISNESQVTQAAIEILKKYGKIDGLINNAANNPKVEDTNNQNFTRLENFPLEIWNMDIAIGLTGSFLCAKHFGNIIAKNLKGGSIINISSDLGLIGPDQSLYRKSGIADNLQNVKPVTYSVVKSGLIGLTRYLATYWPEKNVRCNAICPGGVENGQSQEFLKEVSKRIPMGRLASSDEYQGAIIWILSDAASYMNGAIISIDGGRTAW